MKRSFKQAFGTLPDGSEVSSWTLSNRHGMEVEVLEYDAIIRRISVPVAVGKAVDVVLGFGAVGGYLRDEAWIGAVAGRVAGRISGGLLWIDGTCHQLPVNNPPNHLHGGSDSFNRKLWRGELAADGNGIRLVYQSPHGEQGYPGDLDVAITYGLTDDNELVFTTEAVSSQATPASLTQHTYFNLAGEGCGDTLDHTLAVFSETMIPSADDGTLTDHKLPMEGTASDLRNAGTFRDVIPHVPKRHLDLYWFGNAGETKRMARLHSPESGISMEVSSTHDCLQAYSPVSLDCCEPGKSGRNYGEFAGVCLEAHGYPNACHIEGFGNILTEPGVIQKHVTTCAFHHTEKGGLP